MLDQKSGQLYQVRKVDCKKVQLRSVVIQLQKEKENVRRTYNNKNNKKKESIGGKIRNTYSRRKQEICDAVLR